MTQWLTTVSELVTAAAVKAGLGHRLAAFDGDAWVWIWRHESKPDRTTEERLRIRPDSLNEGVEFELSAVAWMESQRAIAANRMVWSQFVRTVDLQEQSTGLLTALAHHLGEGRRSAVALGEHLDHLNKGRKEMVDDLRARGLLSG
ncbi:MAG: hypothetical protein HYR51_09970 [Candidatus Rokubacteria bacterium]|nr:hypothetical protein [Candidatus Rokubacteria bacterium]